MTCYCTSFLTEFGTFSVAVDARGALVATAFGDMDRLRERCDLEALVCDGTRTREVQRQIKDYLSGRLRTFNLTLALRGTSFQHKVWQRLLRIPFGETRSYGELARELGSSARAVGGASGANPVCVVVPCHRVLGADGSLTGFAFGSELKARLLSLEGGVPMLC